MFKYRWVKLDDVEDMVRSLKTIDIGRETIVMYDDIYDAVQDLGAYDLEDAAAEEGYEE